MKNDKGISLVALVITIVLLLILASITVFSIGSYTNAGRFNKMKADIELLNDKIMIYYKKYGELPVLEEIGTALAINTLGDQRAQNDSDVYYKIDLEKLSNLTLTYGNGRYGSDDIYIINSTTFNVYYLKGVELQGKTHHIGKRYEGTLSPKSSE